MRFLLTCYLVFVANLVASLAFPDEPEKPRREANATIIEYNARISLLRGQSEKATEKIKGVFDEEVSKLKTILLAELDKLLTEEVRRKDLDESIKLRDAIKSFKLHTPNLYSDGDEGERRTSYQWPIVTQYFGRIKLLQSQGTRALKGAENLLKDEVRKLRKQTVDSLMNQVDQAMEARDLDKALVLRNLAKELNAREFVLRVNVNNVDGAKRRMLGKDEVGGTEEMQAGLLFLQYERRSTQKGDNGFIDLHQFDSPTAKPTVRTDGEFSYPESANAVFFGYLKIDRPGTYTFRAYNFYDRSAIFVNDVRVSGYRGSVSNGTDPGNPQKSKEKIQLPSGYIPFAVIGYVDARGAVNEVQWAKPEDASFSKIPPERFF